MLPVKYLQNHIWYHETNNQLSATLYGFGFFDIKQFFLITLFFSIKSLNLLRKIETFGSSPLKVF